MPCGLVRDREIFRKTDRGMLGGRISRAADLRQQAGRRNRVEEIAAAARLHARDQMPRGIDMRHDMDRPASRPRLVGGAAGIVRHRIEAAADAGIGAEQRDRAELPLGLLDDMEDVLFLRDIAFERRAIDRGGDGSRAGARRYRRRRPWPRRPDERPRTAPCRCRWRRR